MIPEALRIETDSKDLYGFVYPPPCKLCGSTTRVSKRIKDMTKEELVEFISVLAKEMEAFK